MKSPRFRADLMLLGAAFLWGSAFVAQRLAAQHLGFFLFNGLRFMLGGLALLPFVRFRLGIQRKDLPLVLIMGFLMFTGGAFQQAGIRYTNTANAGFITGMYVVLIPLLLTVFWRQRIRTKSWAAALLALVGMLLLSGAGQGLVLAPGDGLELLGAVAWAFHVILVGKAVQRMSALSITIGQNLVAGVINLAFAGFADLGTFDGLRVAGWTVVYTGIFSLGLAFALQASAQKVAPPTDAAILLSMEAVFAALGGYLLLGEALSPIQIVGCAVMLAAIVLSQWKRVES